MVETSVETLTTDRLDRRLIHALSLDGRLPFRRIASVLGSSEQTVARRYRRLREAGVLRLITLRDPRRARENQFFRIRTTPGNATPLGVALAKRPDIAWVTTGGAGTELLCSLWTDDPRAREALVSERLPRVGQVTDVRSALLLNVFADDPLTEWHGLEDPLTAKERAALRPRPPRSGIIHAGADEGAFTAEDEALLEHMREDGRITYAALAAATGRREDAVARRVDALLGQGTIVVDIEIAPIPLGYLATAMLWLTVAPAELDRVGREVSLHPETTFTAAVSGPANLFASVLCRDTGTLYRYLTERLGRIDAIRDVEVDMADRRIKQAGTIMDGDRLPSP